LANKLAKNCFYVRHFCFIAAYHFYFCQQNSNKKMPRQKSAAHGEKEDKIQYENRTARFEPHLIGYFATCLIMCRVLSALFQPIADCDEVFNYWEPTHLVLHHNDAPTHTNSFQTWEYSPEFALRSYLYVIIHAAIAKFWSLVLPLVLGTVATKVCPFLPCKIVLSHVYILDPSLFWCSYYIGCILRTLRNCIYSWYCFPIGQSHRSCYFLVHALWQRSLQRCC